MFVVPDTSSVKSASKERPPENGDTNGQLVTGHLLCELLVADDLAVVTYTEVEMRRRLK